jgi:hypothetical protein
MTMSDTFERATRNTKQAQAIRTFAGDFMKVLQEEAPKS